MCIRPVGSLLRPSRQAVMSAGLKERCVDGGEGPDSGTFERVLSMEPSRFLPYVLGELWFQQLQQENQEKE